MKFLTVLQTNKISVRLHQHESKVLKKEVSECNLLLCESTATLHYSIDNYKA